MEPVSSLPTDRAAPAAAPPDLRSGLTLRSAILGLCVVLLICIGAPTSIWMVGSSEITWSFFPVSVGFSFIAIVLANGLVKKLRRSWALRTPELITIVTMGLVASGIPIFIVGTLLSIPSKPYYGATPENQWAVFLQPYLPEWIIPSPDGDAMRYFYEGSPRGMPVPFDAWLGPLAWWLSIIFAVYFLCFCVVVVMRRQWVDNERLVFPVTEVPRLLAEDQPGRSLPPILNSRAFWIGCAVPLGVILFNAVSFWHPGFPRLDVHRGISFSLFTGAPDILVRLYFPVIGFVYLIATPISFSVWFFYLLLTAEAAVANWAGLTVTPDAYIYSPTQALSWQCGGAFAAMVVWGFWMARRHLRAVLRSVFRGAGELDDSREMCSYRLAVIGGIAAAVYILAWFWKSGIDLYIAALLLASVMIVYIGITRLAIQSGVLYITATFSPQALTTAIAGTDVNPHALVGIALSYSWASDIQSIFMTAAAHGARLNELGRNQRRLAIAIAIAVAVGFAVSIYFLLVICYKHGAGNFRSWFFDPGAGAGGRAFDEATRRLGNPETTDWTKLSLFGAGALVYSLLSVCQYRFHWWPLHPVGLTMASLWNMRLIWTAVFIAWACKVVVMRTGGITLYRELRPFFIGLIVGFYLGVGFSYGIDMIWFFGKGHAILHG